MHLIQINISFSISVTYDQDLFFRIVKPQWGGRRDGSNSTETSPPREPRLGSQPPPWPLTTFGDSRSRPCCHLLVTEGTACKPCTAVKRLIEITIITIVKILKKNLSQEEFTQRQRDEHSYHTKDCINPSWTYEQPSGLSPCNKIKLFFFFLSVQAEVLDCVRGRHWSEQQHLCCLPPGDGCNMTNCLKPLPPSFPTMAGSTNNCEPKLTLHPLNCFCQGIFFQLQPQNYWFHWLTGD